MTDVTSGIADDLPAVTGTTGTVAVGGTATGEIEYNDSEDWFAVTLEAGKTYRFDLEGRVTSGGTLSDAYLRGIYDADGNLIPGTTNDENGVGQNGRVDFTATEAGTYYVSAGAWNDREGTYTLRVTDVSNGIPDDYTAGTGTSGTLAVDGTATGEIEYGSDHDWFAVMLEAGKTYRFGIEGSPSANGYDSLLTPYLSGLHDADGDLIDGTADSDVDGRVDFTRPRPAHTTWSPAPMESITALTHSRWQRLCDEGLEVADIHNPLGTTLNVEACRGLDRIPCHPGLDPGSRVGAGRGRLTR